jgi:CRP-like cAMP-binding protein
VRAEPPTESDRPGAVPEPTPPLCYTSPPVSTHARPPDRTGVAAALGKVGLLASLTADERADIAPCFVQRSFEHDTALFFEGEPPESLYAVLDGHVKLIKHSDDGRDVILRVAMPGDVLGAVSAFGRRPHPFTALAMVPVTSLRVAGTDFAAIMKRFPPVAVQTVDDLIERLLEAHETMKSLATERVERRIARQLVRLVDRTGRPVADGVAIGVPLTRQDVADLAGTTVETAIRILSRWRREGRVRTVDGRIVVGDVTALRAVAEEGRET